MGWKCVGGVIPGAAGMDGSGGKFHSSPFCKNNSDLKVKMPVVETGPGVLI